MLEQILGRFPKGILYSWDMAVQAVSVLVLMFCGMAETWKIMLMLITLRLPSLNSQHVLTTPPACSVEPVSLDCDCKGWVLRSSRHKVENYMTTVGI